MTQDEQPPQANETNTAPTDVEVVDEATAIARQVRAETALQPELRRGGSSVDRFIDRALEGKADIDVLEKLLEMRRQEKADMAREAYVSAMVHFRAACPTIAKTRRVDFTSGKGRTQYTFAGLPETVEQIQPLMAECQLSATWTTVSQKPDWIEIRCDVSHVMGHRESMTLGGGPDNTGGKNALQMIASTITYLRRTTLFSLLGLVAKDEGDDDGAGGKKTEPAKPAAAEVLDPDVNAAKRQFAAVCLKLCQKNALPPKVLEQLLADCQKASGKQGIGECAAWLAENAQVRQVDGAWKIVPGKQG